MSEETFKEIIDGLEIVQSLTLFGRKGIKENVLKLYKKNELLQQENKKYKEVIDKLNQYLKSNDYAKDYEFSCCRTTLLEILKEVE